MRPSLLPEVTPPTALPVSIETAKAQSVVDYGDDDALIEGYIQAAVSYLDGPTGILGRAVMLQDVVQRYSGFSTYMRIPFGSVSSITSVEYFGTDNVKTSLTGYTLLRDGCGDKLYFPDTLPGTFARPDAVVVTYQAGWESAASVPASIKQAIQLLVSHWFNQREAAIIGDMRDIPFGVAEMVAPFRRVGI